MFKAGADATGATGGADQNIDHPAPPLSSGFYFQIETVNISFVQPWALPLNRITYK